MTENFEQPVLPTEDGELYRQHVQALTTALEPVGVIESELVQRIADTEWRLKRIANLEMDIYELGRLDFGDFFAGQDEPTRVRLIRSKTYLFYQKQFASLSLQESRLRRYLEKDMNELKALQCHRAPRDTEEDVPAKWPAPWPVGVKASKSSKENQPVRMPDLVISRERTPDDPSDMPEVKPGVVEGSRVKFGLYCPDKRAA
jgi:hypothetical protein